MKSILATVVALLASSAVAVPGSYYQNPKCKPDKCLKSLNAASASNDCKASPRTTVTPCPTTVVKTKTVTITKPTTTLTHTVLDVPTTTVIKPITSVTTIFDVATVQVASRVLLSSTVVVPAAVTLSNAIAPDKRAAPNTCRAKVSSATALPKCARACSGGKIQFSSACSCLGVMPQTTTLPQSTATSTTTKTITHTPIVTVTNTQRATSVFTVVQTTIVPVIEQMTTSTTTVESFFTEVTVVSITKETTATTTMVESSSTGATVTSVTTEATATTTAVQSFSTDTAVVSVTSTTTASAPPADCTGFALQAQSQLSGVYYFGSGSPKVKLQRDLGTAIRFTMDGMFLKQVGTNLQLSVDIGIPIWPAVLGNYNENSNYSPVYCTSQAAGSDILLQCNGPAESHYISSCPEDNGAIRIEESTLAVQRCGQLTLKLVNACVTE